MESQKILWVEDDAIKLKGLVRPLEKDGHKIFYAEDQEEALGLIEIYDFNLIVVDLLIPIGKKWDTGINHFVGVNLIKILKEKKILTPICVLSVVRDPDIIQQIKSMGVEKFLQKGSLLPSMLKKEIYDMLYKAPKDDKYQQ